MITNQVSFIDLLRTQPSYKSADRKNSPSTKYVQLKKVEEVEVENKNDENNSSASLGSVYSPVQSYNMFMADQALIKSDAVQNYNSKMAYLNYAA